MHTHNLRVVKKYTYYIRCIVFCIIKWGGKEIQPNLF